MAAVLTSWDQPGKLPTSNIQRCWMPNCVLVLRFVEKCTVEFAGVLFLAYAMKAI